MKNIDNDDIQIDINPNEIPFIIEAVKFRCSFLVHSLSDQLSEQMLIEEEEAYVPPPVRRGRPPMKKTTRGTRK
jgi:hypothetical protein